MPLLDASHTSWLSCNPHVDDAYSAWFNANSRCSVALRAWEAAAPENRGAAYRAYLTELRLEEAAAAQLAELHAMHTAG